MSITVKKAIDGFLIDFLHRAGYDYYVSQP